MFNFKSASIAQLREFASTNNLVIEGDKRLRATYEKAIALFLSAKDEAIALAKETVDGAIECVKEHATYDNAVIVANTTAVWSRKGAIALTRILWSTLLITVALVVLTIEAFQKRDLVIVYVREERDRLVRWTRAKLHCFQLIGWATVQYRAIRPVMDFRTRILRGARAISE